MQEENQSNQETALRRPTMNMSRLGIMKHVQQMVASGDLSSTQEALEMFTKLE